MSCPGDNAVRAFVEGALGADELDQFDEHLDACQDCRRLVAALAEETRSQADPSRRIAAGTPVGRYTVLSPLGVGGTAVVYAAHDPDLDRRVALKLLRPKSPTGEAVDLDRLQREGQTMARLSHPNVASVYDVGQQDGSVFIAMEPVEAGTLRDWLAESTRDWRAVAAIFLEAGRGLAAAHRAGVVHRDFKPQNVLIAGDGRAMVTDFGLARQGDRSSLAGAEGQRGVDLTETGTLQGTPAYMSPEQHRGETVEAPSDQFSFCVALWEGLYGDRPFAGDSLSELASNVLDGKKAAPPRDVRVPRKLVRLLHRGLSVRPEDRYPSLDSLLGELESLVRPRRGVLLASAGIAVGAIGLGFFFYGGSETEVCSGADKQIGDVWNKKRRQAIERTFAATELPYASDLSSAVAKQLDRYSNSWSEMRSEACKATHIKGTQSSELLDLRMACLETRRKALETVISTLSTADEKLVPRALPAVESLPTLAECADTERLKLRVAPPDEATKSAVAEIESALARAGDLRLRGDVKGALELATETAQKARDVGHPPSSAAAHLLVGDLQTELGDFPAARSSFLEAVWAGEAGRDDRAVARAWTALVRLVGSNQGEHDAGLENGRHAKAMLERLGGDALLEAELYNNLGAVHYGRADYEAAAAAFEDSLKLRQSVLEPGDRRIATALNNLGVLSKQLGQYKKALDLHQQSLKITRKTLGDSHPSTAMDYNNTAEILRILERYDEAYDYYQKALEIRLQVYGEDHRDVVQVLNNLGLMFREKSDAATAREHYQRALAITERVSGPDHPETAMVVHNLGLLAADSGRFEEAAAHYQRALDIKRAALPEGHPSTSITHNALAYVLRQLGKLEEALEHYRLSAKIQRQAFGDDAPELTYDLIGIGECLLDMGDARAAVDSLRHAVEQWKKDEAGDPGDRAAAEFSLAKALWATGRRDEAVRIARRAEEGFAENEERDRKELTEVREWLKAQGDVGHIRHVRHSAE